MFFQIAGAVLGAVGQMQQAKAAATASDQRARQMKIDREVGKIQARQQQTARQEQYFDDLAANEAYFAFNRDVGGDMSVEAFLNREKDPMRQDISRMGFQASMESSSRATAALVESERAKNSLVAGRLNAMTTLAYGIAQAQRTAAGASGGGGL